MLLIASLIALSLTLSARFSHLEEAAAKVSAQSAEEAEGWAEIELGCSHECLNDVHAKWEKDPICSEDQDEESCAVAQAAAEAFTIVQCSSFCNDLVKRVTEDFGKCAEEKCNGNRSESCATNVCNETIVNSFKTHTQELVKAYEDDKTNYTNLTIEDMGDEEAEFWKNMTDNCTAVVIAEATAEIELGVQCDFFDFECQLMKANAQLAVLESSGDYCQATTDGAITVYEACSKLKCEGKRTEECGEKCIHAVGFYYWNLDHSDKDAEEAIAHDYQEEEHVESVDEEEEPAETAEEASEESEEKSSEESSAEAPQSEESKPEEAASSSEEEKHEEAHSNEEKKPAEAKASAEKKAEAKEEKKPEKASH